MITRAIIIASLCAASLAANAGNSLSDVRQRGRLVISVKNVGTEDHAKHKDPAHFEKRGVEIELAKAIAQRVLGDSSLVEYKMMQKPLRLPAVASGDVDLSISMVHVTPKSKAIVDFSVPYYEGGVAVLEPKTGNTASLEDLSGKRVGIISRHDSNTADELKQLPENRPPASVTNFAKFDDAATAIRKGEIDALLSERANIKVYVDSRGSDLRESPPLTREQIAVAVKKGNESLLQVVNETIDEMRNSGRLASLLSASRIAE